ncbi:MAG: mechanosensitive ion channel protein MscS [Flavobacteriales bacterium]|nr:MAG: mechanosensitive ion channel protein MscS [Flavobacteriales bacterium]
METLNNILNYSVSIGENGSLSIKTLVVIIVAFVITSFLLRLIRKVVTRKLPENDKTKFISVFSYLKYFIFLIILLAILSANGVKVTAIITGAAALLLGVGLALQTFFQDIISGIFILLDQTLHVGDVIEMEGKMARVEKISLRTTKAITRGNKVLIIPNHFYLTNMLYNWTQNGEITREEISVGVAYGSDVELVREVLLKATQLVEGILQTPPPGIFFTEFADSSLNFKIVFTVKDCYEAVRQKSELHFKINKLFIEHGISIPFPQRDIHIYKYEPVKVK